MIALLSLFAGSEKSPYESPEYKVVEKEGSFEIRDYPELTLVSTPMQKRGEEGSFMKLFRFISGRNDRSQKISMTTPVLMTGTESGTMSFIVPKNVALQGVPMPSNPDVTISTNQPARYAVFMRAIPKACHPSKNRGSISMQRRYFSTAASSSPTATSPLASSKRLKRVAASPLLG